MTYYVRTRTYRLAVTTFSTQMCPTYTCLQIFFRLNWCKIFTKVVASSRLEAHMIHTRLNFASESSAVVRELFLCFTCSHHFCSIVSDISSNMQRSRITCSNCGVVGVTTDPCEFCRMLPQCRKCRRRMPTRCFAKSTTANICEVRHVLSVSFD